MMDSKIEFENYTVIKKDQNRKSGGVCVYISSDNDVPIYLFRKTYCFAHVAVICTTLVLKNANNRLQRQSQAKNQD